MIGNHRFRSAIAAVAALCLSGCWTTIRDLRLVNDSQRERIAELEKNHEEYTRAYYDLKTRKENDDTAHQEALLKKDGEIASLKRLHTAQLADAQRAKGEVIAHYKEQLEQRAAKEIELNQHILDLEKQNKQLESDRESTQANRDSLAALLEKAQGELKKAQEGNKTAEGQLGAARQEIEALKKDAKRWEEEANSLKGSAADFRTEQLERQRKLQQDIEEREKKIEEQKAEIAKLGKEIEALEKAKKEQDEKLEQLAELQDSIRKDLAQRREVLRGVGNRLDEILKAVRQTDVSDSSKIRQVEDLLVTADRYVQNAPKVMPPELYLKKLYSKALGDLKSDIDKGVLAVLQDDRGVVVRIPADELFTRWTEVRASAIRTLTRVAVLANDHPECSILIEGHTDSDRIVRAQFYDNLELSMQRSINVYRKMVEEVRPQVDPGRIRAVGCGQYRPIASNKTAEGKRKNRRVEFVFTPLY